MFTYVRHSCVIGTRCSAKLTLNQRDLTLNSDVDYSKSRLKPFKPECNFPETSKSLRLISNCADFSLLSYSEVHRSAPNLLRMELAEISEVVIKGLRKLKKIGAFIWQYYASSLPAKIEAVDGFTQTKRALCWVRPRSFVYILPVSVSIYRSISGSRWRLIYHVSFAEHTECFDFLLDSILLMTYGRLQHFSP